jgi:cytochrome c-type protein NapC
MADPEESNEQPGPRKKSRRWLWLLAIGAVAGVVFSAAFAVSLEATSSNAFCAGACHSMTTPYEEYKESPHYGNFLGINATCADCHIPKDFGPKLYRKATAGANDVFHTMLGTIDTPEKYEAQRWEMAQGVWERMRANDSQNCRNCHNTDQWKIDEQSRFAQREHKDRGERTCIDCHTGVAHKEPIEPAEESVAEN